MRNLRFQDNKSIFTTEITECTEITEKKNIIFSVFSVHSVISVVKKRGHSYFGNANGNVFIPLNTY